MHGQVVQCCLPWQLLKLIPFAKCPAMCYLTIHNLCAVFFRAIRTRKSNFPKRYLWVISHSQKLIFFFFPATKSLLPFFKGGTLIFFTTCYLFHPSSYIVLECKIHFLEVGLPLPRRNTFTVFRLTTSNNNKPMVLNLRDCQISSFQTIHSGLKKQKYILN